MLVSKREDYAVKNQNSVTTETGSVEKTSAEQGTVQIQETTETPIQTKAATDLANAKRFDGQLQSSLLKERLLQQSGNFQGLEKQATKFAGGEVGEIKDNLFKDIARHDGPRISEMLKMGLKQRLGESDPLAGQPQMPGDKKAPDMPYRKNDPSLVSAGGTKLTGEDPPKSGGGTKLTGEDPPKSGGDTKTVLTGEDPKTVLTGEDGKAGGDTKTVLTGEDPKTVLTGEDEDGADGGTKNVDSDPTGYGNTTQVDIPEERPLDAKDLLGRKVDGGNTLVGEYDSTVHQLIQQHMDRDKPLIYLDPDHVPTEVTFDPNNPVRLEGEELKNTGNPIENNAPKPQTNQSGGDQPHTDGEGGMESGGSQPNPTVKG